MLKRLFLQSLALLGTVSLSFCVQAQAVSQEGFLIGSIRYEIKRGETRATDYNWGEWKLIIPAGTPVRGNYAMMNGARKNWAWLIVSDKVSLNLINDNHRKVPDSEFLKRYITNVDPRPQMATFTPEVQEAISLGRVAIGMTREQVIMAMGTPPAPDNPNIVASTWVYYWGSFDDVKVLFDEDNKVRAVIALPFALADMLYPVPKK